MIRTVVLNGTHASVGAGGAIIALSDPVGEFDETMLKGELLRTTLMRLDPSKSGPGPPETSWRPNDRGRCRRTARGHACGARRHRRRAVELLGRRFRTIRAVAEHKRLTGLAVMQPSRVQEVLATRLRRAGDAGLDPKLVERLWTTIITHACQIEKRWAGSRGASSRSRA